MGADFSALFLKRGVYLSTLVSIKNLYKSFFGAMALNGMNFELNEGEVRCLIGENGCGKSTMIKVISGFHDYDSGEIYINGKKFNKITPSESIAEGIQVIYQDFSLFPNMTVAENIMMYETVAHKKPLINWKTNKQRALEVMNKIQLDVNPDAYVSDITVAQKQMVAICRAIVQNTKLLIMDEPTTALTNKEVDKLFEIVRQIKKEGVSVLFVSHKLDEISEICDSFTIMRNGQNVYQSNKGDAPLSNEDMIYYMTGRKFSSVTHEYKENDPVPALKLNKLSLEGAFYDIDISLYKGEVLGITGLLGCGRSELALSLFGLLPAESGSIEVMGKKVELFKCPDDAIAQSIAYIPEDRLTEGLDLKQPIASNAICRIIRDNLDKFGLLNLKVLKDKQEKALGLMDVRGMVPGNPASSLSGGNQQKIVLIKWLASNPKIIILNCPTVGVDVGAKSDIHKMIRDLAKEQGVAVIVISNDSYELMQTCNRVLIMKNGMITQEVDIKDTSMDDLEERIARG